MLEYLHVKNLALIKEAELLLSGGLNILSGETGAGKSVLLGSVNLALGARADKSLIRTNAPYALIELRFRTEEPETLESLRALGIEPEDGEIILSRKILPDRSFARLQGEIVNVSLLSKVSELLINIHGQHDHQKLLREEMHLHVLDEYGKEALEEVKKAYGEAYRKYRQMRDELNALGSGGDEERETRMAVRREKDPGDPVHDGRAVIRRYGGPCSGSGAAFRVAPGLRAGNEGSFRFRVSAGIHAGRYAARGPETL